MTEKPERSTPAGVPEEPTGDRDVRTGRRTSVSRRIGFCCRTYLGDYPERYGESQLTGSGVFGKKTSKTYLQTVAIAAVFCTCNFLTSPFGVFYNKNIKI